MDQMLAARTLTARALLLGERLDHRGLERQGPQLAGVIPLACAGPGQAFAFRWGAIVPIGAEEKDGATLAARLHPRLHEPLPQPTEEIAMIRLDPGEEGPDTTGVIRLRDLSLPRQALLAELLARSALLSHQEAALARSLDRLDPIVARLRRGRLIGSSAGLLRSIGEALAARARAAARVDTSASPDLLWDHPELSDLHDRLADEWELPDRSNALERKLAMIRDYQAKGHLVAMTGDGTNDAPALAQADVAVAMNSGTQAAKEAGNMVDLDSNPTKLIEVVEIGKQMLATRGALTTFSIANDVAKYFAIIPAAFASTYPVLDALNIMRLATPESAILSAVIFNALIIVALIPLALKGVRYRPLGAAAVLRRHVWIYGIGGIIVPFPGIKLIDMILVALGLV